MQQEDIVKLYKRKQVESASPIQLVVLLYDGGIEYLNRAEKALAETGFDQFEKLHNNLIGCQNIITELTVALNLEDGGDIAHNLMRLYDYMNHRLIDANIQKKVKIIHEVRGLLITLKDAWLEVKSKEHRLDVKKTQKSGLNIQG